MAKQITRKEARAKVRAWIIDQDSREAAAVLLKVSITTLDNLVREDYKPGIDLAVEIEEQLGFPPRVWVRGVAAL